MLGQYKEIVKILLQHTFPATYTWYTDFCCVTSYLVIGMETRAVRFMWLTTSYSRCMDFSPSPDWLIHWPVLRIAGVLLLQRCTAPGSSPTGPSSPPQASNHASAVQGESLSHILNSVIGCQRRWGWATSSPAQFCTPPEQKHPGTTQWQPGVGLCSISATELTAPYKAVGCKAPNSNGDTSHFCGSTTFIRPHH